MIGCSALEWAGPVLCSVSVSWDHHAPFFQFPTTSPAHLRPGGAALRCDPAPVVLETKQDGKDRCVAAVIGVVQRKVTFLSWDHIGRTVRHVGIDKEVTVMCHIRALEGAQP